MGKPVEFYPQNGGQLFSTFEDEAAGAANYIVKLNWRREHEIERRCEGRDAFYPKTTVAIGNQAVPDPSTPNDPLTFLGLAQRADGDFAVIAGTKTKLFRFYAFNNGGYFEDAYIADGYFTDLDGEWITIGSGFSASGRRWEGNIVAGRLMLNNGVDLPQLYDLGTQSVEPVYELRDQGVIAVGTISEINGVLMTGDIWQLSTKQLETDRELLVVNPLITLHQTLSGWIIPSIKAFVGDTIAPATGSATQTGTTVTAAAPIFGPSDVNRYVVWADGHRTKITAYTSNVMVTVEDSEEVTTATGITVIGPGKFVVAATILFQAGKTVRFESGYRAVLTFGTLGWAAVAGALNDLIYPARTFEQFDDVPSNYYVTASSAIFDSTHVGQYVIWNDGETRKILALISSTQVQVDRDFTHAAQNAELTNPRHYRTYTPAERTDYDRFGYRALWSNLDAPSQFKATATVDVTAGNNVLELDFPVQWLKSGMEVLIEGVGVNGANLLVTVDLVYDGGTRCVLAALPSTTKAGALMQASNQVGGISAFEDLEDDGAAIQKMVPTRRNRLAVYKELAGDKGQIFLCEYTGREGVPFQFERVYEGPNVPRFRHSIISVEGDAHLFAGWKRFLKFDELNRLPMPVAQLEGVEDTFYEDGDLSDPESIFAVDNLATKEIWLCFPSSNQDKVIRYDYRRGTVGTGDEKINAAAMVMRPRAASETFNEPWFLMSVADAHKVWRYGLVLENDLRTTASTDAGGTVLTLGASVSEGHRLVGRTVIFLTSKVVTYITGWTNNSTFTVAAVAQQASQQVLIAPGMWHRDGGVYSSILQSGGERFGSSARPKRMSAYEPLLGEGLNYAQIAVDIMGKNNTGQDLAVLGSRTLTDPVRKSLVPTNFLKYFLGYRLTVSGKNNPCEVMGHIFQVEMAGSKGVERLA